MIVRNIYTERKEPLEMFEDERGKILDRDLASSVFPTPASPSSKSGLFNLSNK